MVLVLQLDDDGNPSGDVDSPLPSGTISRNISTSNRSVGHSETANRGNASNQSFPPPPAYSSLSLSAYAHHHQTQLRLDQPWPIAAHDAQAGSSDSEVDRALTSWLQSSVANGKSPADNQATGPVDNIPSDEVTMPPPPLAALLRGYPIVISLVSHLDQTDVSSLAQTCRAVQSGLSQFRGQVLAHTLRCVREATPRDPTTAAPPRWFPPCARDLVAPCRRCSQVVCRNCTAKPAGGLRMTQRHRRLCRACQTGPLSQLGLGGVGSREKASLALAMDGTYVPSRGIDGPCSCANTGVHICRGCNDSQVGADMTYARVWSWRSRYRNLGFGLGTGVGEGNEGVKCGRGAACLAARDLIVDMDCAEAMRSARARFPGGSTATVRDVAAAYLIGGGGIGSNASERPSEDTPPTPSTPLTPMIVDSGILDAAGAGIGSASSPIRSSSSAMAPADDLSRPSSSFATSTVDEQSVRDHLQDGKNESAGYYRQEIEGIGGVVKKKLKKRVRVGATVIEYEDESQTGAFLERERTGAMRSWCAWCHRIIPSLADVEMIRETAGLTILRTA